MDAVPENEQFDIFTLNEDDCNRIRDMYYESVGIKIKKVSTRKTKWENIMKDHKITEIRSYLKELSKRKKVSIKTAKDDREPEDEAEIIEIPNPAPKKSPKSFKKRMAEYGPNHPEKPKTAFNLFKAKMKQNGITDSKEVSKLYKTDSEDVRECKAEAKEALDDYKESVTAWVETLDANARELYEANEMRKAKKSDPNNKSQIMVEAGTENLDYLDMQPKTPAAPHTTESSDDEDED